MSVTSNDNVRITEGFTPEAMREQAKSGEIQARSDARNDPVEILARLKGSLPKMHKGGVVAKTGPVILKRGERVIPAPEDQSATDTLAAKARQSSQPGPDETNPRAARRAQSQAAPQSDETGSKESSVSDENAASGNVNIMKLYSRMQSAIGDLFLSLGVRPSLNLPHISGEDMASHITAVGQALQTVSGGSKNFVVATHTRHDPKGGSTQAFPSDKLRTAIIPKGSEAAADAVKACRNLINKIAGLIPDDEPIVKQAKARIQLIGQNDLSGMTAFDAGASLILMIHPLMQLLARLHSFHKHGAHHPVLTGPLPQQDQQQ